MTKLQAFRARVRAGLRKEADSLWPGGGKSNYRITPTHIVVTTDDREIPVERWEGTGGFLSQDDEYFREDSPDVVEIRKIESKKTANGPIVFDDPMGARYCAIETVGLGPDGDYSGVATATKRIVGVGAREIYVCDAHVDEGVEYVATGNPYWSSKHGIGEYDELGRMFNTQIEDMKDKVKADTLPCPEHKDKEAEKLGTYASFPSSYTEYECPEGHTFKVRVGTTREDILAEGSRKMALHKATSGNDPDLGSTTCDVCGKAIHIAPGGQGRTWVHSDTGAVAGPEGVYTLPLPLEGSRKQAIDVDWSDVNPDSSDDEYRNTLWDRGYAEGVRVSIEGRTLGEVIPEGMNEDTWDGMQAGWRDAQAGNFKADPVDRYGSKKTAGSPRDVQPGDPFQVGETVELIGGGFMPQGMIGTVTRGGWYHQGYWQNGVYIETGKVPGYYVDVYGEEMGPFTTVDMVKTSSRKTANTMWHIKDARGVWLNGEFQGYADYGGSDVPYFFQTSQGYKVVSGSYLKESHPASSCSGTHPVAASRKTAEDHVHQWAGDPLTGDQPQCSICGATRPKESRRKTAARALYEIAADIRRAWGSNVNYAAKPYLDAMSGLGSLDDMYGADDARSIVSYFLVNAASFRGEDARRLKQELKDLLAGKTSSKMAYGPPPEEWPDTPDSEKSFDTGWIKIRGQGWVYDPEGAAALKRVQEADIEVAKDFAQDIGYYGRKQAAPMSDFFDEHVQFIDATPSWADNWVDRGQGTCLNCGLDKAVNGADICASCWSDPAVRDEVHRRGGSKKSSLDPITIVMDQFDITPRYQVRRWNAELGNAGELLFETDDADEAERVSEEWASKIIRGEARRKTADATGPHSEVILTDSYGNIPRGLYYLLRRSNVSPSDFDGLVDEFGMDFAAIAQAVKDRTDTMYRAPWPLGSRKTAGVNLKNKLAYGPYPGDIPTPWGYSQDIQESTSNPGVIQVSTASHGGIFVPDALIGPIPQKYRDQAFHERGGYWFEEDVAGNIPLVYLPGLAAEWYPTYPVEKMQESIRYWIDEYESPMASRRALNEQSGHGESDLDDVEVTDDNADEQPMWPWEISDEQRAADDQSYLDATDEMRRTMKLAGPPGRYEKGQEPEGYLDGFRAGYEDATTIGRFNLVNNSRSNDEPFSEGYYDGYDAAMEMGVHASKGLSVWAQNELDRVADRPSSTCQMCGQGITRVGDTWRHYSGDADVEHRARPRTAASDQVEVGDPNDVPMWPVELDDDTIFGVDAADVEGVPTPGQEVADYPQVNPNSPDDSYYDSPGMTEDDRIALRRRASDPWDAEGRGTVSGLLAELNDALAEYGYPLIDEATAVRWAKAWSQGNVDEWRDAGGSGSMTENDEISFAISNAGEIAEYFGEVELDVEASKRSASLKTAYKAIAIYPDKRVEEVEIGDYTDIQAIVGGNFDVVSFGSKGDMWVNDEFIFSFGPEDFNSIATDVAGLGGRTDLLLGGIKGPVVVTGPPDASGETTGINEEGRRMVQRVSREARRKTAQNLQAQCQNCGAIQEDQGGWGDPIEELPCNECGATELVRIEGSRKQAQPESWSEIQYQEEHGYLPDQGMSAEDIEEWTGGDPDELQDFIDSMPTHAPYVGEDDEGEDYVDAGWVEEASLKMAWNPEGSDITPMAKQLMALFDQTVDELGGADAWNFGVNNQSIRPVVVEVFASKIQGMIGQITQADIDSLEDYNYHSVVEAILQRHASKTAEDLTTWKLRGYQDFKNQDPWANAPVSYEDWHSGAADTPESLAYWEGFGGGADEAMNFAQKNASKTAEWYDELDDKDESDDDSESDESEGEDDDSADAEDDSESSDDDGAEESSEDEAVEDEDSAPKEVEEEDSDDEDSDEQDKEATLRFRQRVQASLRQERSR